MDKVLIAIASVALSALVFLGGAEAQQQITMKQAHDRGYAVQCVGKTGYYWECE